MDQNQAALLDKESTRQIILQVAGFLKIFGGAYPRVLAVAELMDVQATPAIWDKIWAVFESEPEFGAMLKAGSAVAAGETDPKEVAVALRAACKEKDVTLSPEMEEIANLLETDIKPAAKSEEYWRFKRGVAAAIATIQMWSIFLGSRTMQGYVDFIVRMFTLHFDEVWEVEHPEDAD